MVVSLLFFLLHFVTSQTQTVITSNSITSDDPAVTAPHCSGIVTFKVVNCNLELRRDGNMIWESATSDRKTPCTLRILDDGNMRLDNRRGRRVWQTRSSGSGPFRLDLQDDSNLVLVQGDNSPIWNSNTQNVCPTIPPNVIVEEGSTVTLGAIFEEPSECQLATLSLRLQGDGNLALYRGTTVLFATGTLTADPRLTLGADGRLVLSDGAGGTELWSSVAPADGVVGPFKAILTSGGEIEVLDGNEEPCWSTNLALPCRAQVLAPDSTTQANSLWSLRTLCPSEEAELRLQVDGNLVLYRGKHFIWSTQTFAPNVRLDMQPDGNLVLYDQENSPLWNSNTRGSGVSLILQPDANLVLEDAAGLVLWSTGTAITGTECGFWSYASIGDSITVGQNGRTYGDGSCPNLLPSGGTNFDDINYALSSDAANCQSLGNVGSVFERHNCYFANQGKNNRIVRMKNAGQSGLTLEQGFWWRAQEVAEWAASQPKPLLVTVFLGHNDACGAEFAQNSWGCSRWSLDKDNYCRCTPSNYEYEFRQGLDRLKDLEGVTVAIIPAVRISQLCNNRDKSVTSPNNFYGGTCKDLWTDGLINGLSDVVVGDNGICGSLTANSNIFAGDACSQSKRVSMFNTQNAYRAREMAVLAEPAYSHIHYLDQTWVAKFSSADISGCDCFHPSEQGQDLIAEAIWEGWQCSPATPCCALGASGEDAANCNSEDTTTYYPGLKDLLPSF